VIYGIATKETKETRILKSFAGPGAATHCGSGNASCHHAHQIEIKKNNLSMYEVWRKPNRTDEIEQKQFKYENT
jgi:hypothetical protein